MPRQATACNIPGYRYWKPAGACLPVCNYEAGERHRSAFPFACYTPQKGMPGKNRLKKVARLAPPTVAQPVPKKQKGVPKMVPSFYDLLYGSLPPRRLSAAQQQYRDCMTPKLLGQKGLGKGVYRQLFATSAHECNTKTAAPRPAPRPAPRLSDNPKVFVSIPAGLAKVSVNTIFATKRGGMYKKLSSTKVLKIQDPSIMEI